jgi:hypothetical protein
LKLTLWLPIYRIFQNTSRYAKKLCKVLTGRFWPT